MKTTNQVEVATIEITRVEKTIADKLVIYSLFMEGRNGERGFGIRVSCDGENESVVLDCDLFPCVAFFQRLIDGEVFPYSLYELTEDFLAEQKI